MKHTIQLSTCSVEIDEECSLADMERGCYKFFNGGHGRGKRETYTVYRGCLIVRASVKFGGVPVRHTSAYLYLPNGFPDSRGPDTSCITPGIDINGPSGIRNAQRLIDRIITEGRYEYGMTPS